MCVFWGKRNFLTYSFGCALFIHCRVARYPEMSENIFQERKSIMLTLGGSRRMRVKPIEVFIAFVGVFVYLCSPVLAAPPTYTISGVVNTAEPFAKVSDHHPISFAPAVASSGHG